MTALEQEVKSTHENPRKVNERQMLDVLRRVTQFPAFFEKVLIGVRKLYFFWSFRRKQSM